LRRIHDIGIDDDSSKPAKDRRKDTYDALIKMIEFKMGKISKNGRNKYQNPQVPLPYSPTPIDRKGGVWLSELIVEKGRDRTASALANGGIIEPKNRNDLPARVGHPLLNEKTFA
jgi:hypothetical protein